MATSSYQVPRVPAIAAGLADDIHQVLSAGYRNPDEPSPDAWLGGADAPDSPATLDLHAAGITSVVWATGNGRDLAWPRVPVLDDAGAPRNVAGKSGAWARRPSGSSP